MNICRDTELGLMICILSSINDGSGSWVAVGFCSLRFLGLYGVELPAKHFANRLRRRNGGMRFTRARPNFMSAHEHGAAWKSLKSVGDQ